MRFQVVTRVPDVNNDEDMFGNLATALGQVWESDISGMQVRRIDGLVSMGLRIPVFVLGEIMIVDEDGREVAGRFRKASKWDVDVDEFWGDDAYARAIERAREVLNDGL